MKDEEGYILHLSEDHVGWEEINITVDAGVVHTVGPKRIATAFPLIATDASRKGMHGRAANITNIAILGKKQLQGYTWFSFS